MFNTRRFALLTLSLALSLGAVSCQPTAAPLGTQTLQASSQGNLVINNASASLAQRINYTQKSVAFKSSEFSTQQQSSPVDLKLVAQVSPPLVRETLVQATNVHIEGDLAYVSYDIAGDEFSGGAYILDISNPSRPELLAEMTLADTDFYSLTKSGDSLFLSGASPQTGLNSRGLVKVVQLSADGRSFVKASGLIDVPSFAATDVAVSGDTLFVTTGARDGGIAKINTTTLEQEGFQRLEDARSVSLDYKENGESRVTVFRGTPGELHVFDTDLNLLRKTNFGQTATIPFSKSTVEIRDQIAIVGAGDGGTLSVNLDNLEKVSQVRATTGITNGASINGKYTFMAEGEDGVSVALADSTGALTKLGSFQFEDLSSANMVAHQDNVLFVANGRGGLSILTVDYAVDPEPIVGGIQAVYLRWLQAEGNTGSSKVTGQVKLNGPGRIVGVVHNPQNGSQNLAKTDFFAAQIAPELPGLLQNTPGSQQRTLESGDVYTLVDGQTLNFDFSLGNPGGSDDIRLLIDHGDVVQDNDLTVTLDPETSTEAGIIVGQAHEEVWSRTLEISKASTGPIGEEVYTVRPNSHDLIVHREAMVPRSQVPAEFLTSVPEPVPTPVPTPVATPTPVPTPVATPTPEPGPCQGNAQNLVVNGGFESPAITKTWAIVPELECWGLAPVAQAELDRKETWTPVEGLQSLDLNPHKRGEIYQELSTEPGVAYTLKFSLAGNVNGTDGKKTVEVFWGGNALGTYVFDTTGKTNTAMGWESVEVNIPADKTTASRTELRFASRTENSSTGPVLDNVVVVASPIVSLR